MAEKSSRILMFFKLFSSLNMLNWLNLLMPVSKRKRRYWPELFNGLKKSLTTLWSFFCKSGLLLVSNRGESYSSTSTTTCLPVFS